MANYVLTLPLKTEKWQEDILEKRLNIARQIYNACLGEILSRHRLMKRQKEYGLAMKMEKGKKRNAIFNKLRKDFGVTKFDLNKFVKPMGQKFKKNLGSQMVQEIAERSFSAFEKLMFKEAKKVRFKAYGEFHSVREKGNITGFKYFEDRNVMEWLGLTMPVIIKKNDEYANQCFLDKLKFCKLVKKVIRGKNRYFVQITFEGVPPQKNNRKVSTDENSRVGLDIGTSTLAIASEKEVKILELAEDVNIDERIKRVLQRKLDRQRRANNPNKYNKDGTIKKGNHDKWIQSKGYIKTKLALREIQRKIADKRKQSHNKLADYILSLGLDVRVETMNFKGLQKRAKETTVNEKTGKINRKKRFGKSLGNKAPGMLITIIDRKLQYQGFSIKEIDTHEVKASQFEHFTETYVKKPLSKRWNKFEQGNIQRDMYSAFLIMNTKDNLKEVDIDRANMTFENFFKLHNKEIERIRNLDKKQISSIGL
ncbi:transposase [Clostridium botulinum]|uniref:Transposase n=1 Tax=Clostridium botulinum TaxID=1491 RepID=A0AA43Y9T2_CLOBO|nr:transposase [Clostridium botulinum]NFI22919.1 transposase [Clostridium botulinum]NFQ79670.1 transposase [Clostridium botulinum]